MRHDGKVQRPWGWYQVIDEGDRYKTKNIEVNPGASLSLQYHYHRSEHWVVVAGTAKVRVGDEKVTCIKMKVFMYHQQSFIV